MFSVLTKSFDFFWSNLRPLRLTSEMDFSSLAEIWALSSSILLLLFSVNKALDVPVPALEEEEPEDLFPSHMDEDKHMAYTVDGVLHAALHQFRLCTVFGSLDDDLGFWVKPRSTTWFSRFLLEEYGDDRWIQPFRMTKPAL